MSVINEKLLENLKVVKRNGKKVDFDTAKVAIAIKKGFDGANKAEDEEERYTTKDIQKVYQSVIKRILKEYKEEEKIKIENTQWSQHSQVIFTMTFVKKKRNIYDFIFSGNVSAECTEETYALVKSWLPESVRMPKVKF